jgi:tetratricopeptide (TPR) repeat protein
MSTPNPTPASDTSGYLGSECNLGALKKRPQIDFEIDFYERILSRDPAYTEVLFNLGELFSIKGWPRRALQVDSRLAQLRPKDPLVLYNLACSHALLQQREESLAALRRAVEAGYDDFEHLAQDPDLDSLRQSPEFMRFVKDLLAAATPTRWV